MYGNIIQRLHVVLCSTNCPLKYAVVSHREHAVMQCFEADLSVRRYHTEAARGIVFNELSIIVRCSMTQ